MVFGMVIDETKISEKGTVDFVLQICENLF